MAKRSMAMLALAAVVVLGIGGYLFFGTDDYKLKLVMPSAAQLLSGSPVWINGQPVGSVTDIAAQDGKAIVTVSLDKDHSPMHEGMKTRVEWKSVLGERLVSIVPGPAQNAAIPSGAMYEASSTQVEADQVLASLDAPTRQKLSSMLTDLNKTVSGREPDIQATLRSAGPTVNALGNVLAAVGRDGPAIHQLVSQLHNMTSGLAQRQDQVSGTVNHLTRFTGTVAAQQKQLAEGLKEVPSTLDAARTTLDKIPSVTDATVPMLDALGSSTDKLPSVAHNLKPVLDDLGPVLHDLRPTLSATADLLQYTPELFDSAHKTFPKTGQAFEQLGKPLAFLRPYTPELVGWLHNWGQNFAGYDSQGHVWAVGLAQAGPATLNENLGPNPIVGVQQQPAPGSAVGQPWTDANGNGIR